MQSSFFQQFREAAPYIHAFRGKTFVIAVGGEMLSLAGALAALCADVNVLVSLGVRVLVVHGVRPQIDAVLKASGITPRYHGNRRITDAAGILAVRQAVGLARGEIEAALSMALPNSPMSGANLRVLSGNFVTAQPLGVLDGVDMQYTGKVRRVDLTALRQALDSGAVVLLSPLGFSPSGESFNLMMEELATEVARALAAEKLIFLVEHDGLRDAHGEILQALTAEAAQDLLQDHIPEPGNIWNALAACLRALDQVSRAHIVSYRAEGALLTELFTREGSGTLVTRAALAQVRAARLEDVSAILALIAPWVEKGVLIARSREKIEREIAQFFVVEHESCLIATASLRVYAADKMAELGCVAVSGAWRAGGYGELLLQHVLARAKKLGMQAVFVLTTQTAHWFLEQGFVPATLSALPLEKQQLYDHARASQILMFRFQA